MTEALKETVQNLLGVHKHSANGAANGPTEPTTEQFEQTKQAYEKADQGQVFTFWNDLNSTQKAELFAQLKQFDPDHITALAKKVLKPAKTEDKSASIEPIPSSVTSSVLDSEPEDLKKWYDTGLEHIANNQVAVVLMAGGQGTRLGSSAPKGCYDIGLPSKKSLFQMQAERILKLQQLASKAHGKAEAVIPWYVMTSGPTRGPTAKYFEDNKYFGMKKENVFIFEQGVLPCISKDERIIMDSKSKVISHSCYQPASGLTNTF
jgi:UDP-N-acetylglucosamine/UDP-N-acetylgalactosamine diphosphorylase